MYSSLIPLCEYIPLIYEHYFFSPLVRPLTHTTIVVRPNYNSFHITQTWRCEKICLWVGINRKFTPSRNSTHPSDRSPDRPMTRVIHLLHSPTGHCLSTPDKHHLLPVTLSDRMATLFSYSLKNRLFYSKYKKL